MTHQRRSRTSLARLAALPVLAALVAASCGGGSDAGSDDTSQPTATDGGGDTTVVDGGATTTDDGGDDSSADTTAAPTDDTGVEDDDESDGSPVVETLPPEVDAQPVSGGTLRYGLEAEVDGLNPTSSAVTAPSGLVMANAVFDTLAAYDVNGDPVPYLAESFTPNEDYTSWTVKLREGISFHDGTPLNAEAVKLNFDAQYADFLVGLAVRPAYPEEGATEIIDDMTIQFNLNAPEVRWPSRMAGQTGMIASPTWIAAALEDGTLNQAPVGTGPFVFESRSEDSVTRFVRNDDYWNGTPYLDAIEFLPVPEADSRVDLLLGGDLNAAHISDPAAVLTAQDDPSLQNVQDDSGDERFVMMNTSVAPFDDIRARQALTFATPRQDVLDLVYLGLWRPADSRFIPESPYNNPDVVQLADDPDQAAVLVAEYCGDFPENCNDGKIVMEYQWAGGSTAQTRLADLYISGWEPFFEVTRDELLQDENIQQAVFGQYNAVSWTQFSTPDPLVDNVWLVCSSISDLSINFPRLCQPERDALLIEAAATLDDAARADLIQQAEQLISDSFSYIWIGHVLWDYAFAENVHGVCERTNPEGVKLLCVAQGQSWHSSIWLG